MVVSFLPRLSPSALFHPSNMFKPTSEGWTVSSGDLPRRLDGGLVEAGGCGLGLRTSERPSERPKRRRKRLEIGALTEARHQR